MNKKKARKIARETLKKVNNIDGKSQIIMNKISNLEEFKNASTVGLYYPTKDEVNLLKLQHCNKQFAFPKIAYDNNMNFILIDNETKWETNKFGIKEPKSGKIVNRDLDIIIIPSLAKNARNYRLGYGMGYYDKFLSDKGKKLTIGVNYDNIQIDFKEDKWDIPLSKFISN